MLGSNLASNGRRGERSKKIKSQRSIFKKAVNKVKATNFIKLKVSTEEKARLREIKAVCKLLHIQMEEEPAEIINTIHLVIF